MYTTTAGRLPEPFERAAIDPDEFERHLHEHGNHSDRQLFVAIYHSLHALHRRMDKLMADLSAQDTALVAAVKSLTDAVNAELTAITNTLSQVQSPDPAVTQAIADLTALTNKVATETAALTPSAPPAPAPAPAPPAA